MKVSKLTIAFLLVQGIDLAQSTKFVEAEAILQEAEMLEETMKNVYTINNVKLIPLNKEKTSFNLEGFSKGKVYTSSVSFNMLDFNKSFDILIKSLSCREILAYVTVES